MPSYRLDPVAFREELLNADWMEAEMLARAERGKEFAESIAPDAPPYGVGYISSFEVKSGKHGGIHGDRAYAELSNSSEHAVYVEFGNGHDNGDHVLGRAMDVMDG